MEKLASFANPRFLQTYSEKTIPCAGWYWFVPTGGIQYQQECFMRIEEDALDGALHCKRYQGEYSGPINPPTAFKEAPPISINSHVLSADAAKLSWEACLEFREQMQKDGLGEDEHGRKMSALYIARISEIETKIVAAPGETPMVKTESLSAKFFRNRMPEEENKEPDICVNGHQLSSAQAMAMRCALSGGILSGAAVHKSPHRREIFEALFNEAP